SPGGGAGSVGGVGPPGEPAPWGKLDVRPPAAAALLADRVHACRRAPGVVHRDDRSGLSRRWGGTSWLVRLPGLVKSRPGSVARLRLARWLAGRRPWRGGGGAAGAQSRTGSARRR